MSLEIGFAALGEHLVNERTDHAEKFFFDLREQVIDISVIEVEGTPVVTGEGGNLLMEILSMGFCW